MTLIDASLQIAATLAGGAFAVAFIAALCIARGRRRYQGPAPEPYAGFRTGAHAGTGEFLQLACEGHCPGTTAHEITGDEGATCVLCGDTRTVPAPDPA